MGTDESIPSQKAIRVIREIRGEKIRAIPVTGHFAEVSKPERCSWCGGFQTQRRRVWGRESQRDAMTLPAPAGAAKSFLCATPKSSLHLSVFESCRAISNCMVPAKSV
jgi:hypothetical protein